MNESGFDRNFLLKYMPISTQKGTNSTQKFTEILDIMDNIVLFTNGNAAIVIEVTASNFTLLSQREQDSKIYSYAALLNSLTFPIQIIIRNKRMDITSYLKELDEAELITKNPLLAQQIRLYRDFVREMIRVNVVLTKMFYVVIAFSSLESGLSGVKQSFDKDLAQKQAFFEAAQKSLMGKAESIHSQLAGLAVSAQTLGKEELIKLYYDIFNDAGIQGTQADSDINTPLVKTGGTYK